MVHGLVLKRALDRAALLHEGQHRKYPDVKVPYVAHVAGVVAVLARHGFDEEVQAAGALHDVIEDCNVSFATLEGWFGARVAELVRHVTEEDKSKSWEERKHAYVARFPEKPWEAQAISLADKVDNLRSILVCDADHGDPWPLFKRGRDVQLERFEALLAAARASRSHPLVDEYARWLDEVRALPVR